MTRLTETHMIRLSDFVAELDRADRPAWLHELARRAAARFASLGVPTRRHEEWRLTNVETLAQTEFRIAEEPTDVSVEDLSQFDIPGLAGSRIVFVNGSYAPSLTSIESLPKGVLVLPLREAIASHGELVKAQLGKHADAEQDAFTALNTAMLGDGLFVFVPKGTVVERPIHVLNVTAADEANGSSMSMTSPRNLIIIGENAQATIIEDYVALTDTAYFTNAVTEMVVGEHAHAVHYLLERESARAINISTLRINQKVSSNFASHSVLLGGALVRNNIVPVLDGEHCESLLNGLYLTRGRQHVDNHMQVVHAKPNCDSRQFYKGVLSDESTAVFSGRIIVAKDAQKTDAKQSNANLLLTDRCRANTHPQLEIYADDVKCTHGATIGQVDENAVFYLRARGLSEAAARGMLIHAFAEESLERMTLEPIKTYLEGELFSRLPQGTTVRESMDI